MPPITYETPETIHNYHYQNDTAESSNFSPMSPLDRYVNNNFLKFYKIKIIIFSKLFYIFSSMPFDLTMNGGDGTVIPRRSESSIKWLVMPWQVLATSDKGVLTTLEDTLSNSTDISRKVQTCHFITNIMLQDFPAEVFLHRPTTVNVNSKDFETHTS